MQFSIVSDPTHAFAGREGANFDDANLNVGLPVFSVHGNHDDPMGADNLSAMDVVRARSCFLFLLFCCCFFDGRRWGRTKRGRGARLRRRFHVRSLFQARRATRIPP